MTDQKPVDKPVFWRDRLHRALSEGKLWWSVYLVNKNKWMEICVAHEKIIRKHIAKDDSVLDAGCGYGRLADLFDPNQYIGVDISPDLLEKARELYPAHTFILGDMENVEGKFDWAILISIKGMIVGQLGHAKWEAIEKNLRTVSKRILLLEYTDPEQYEILEPL